MMMHDKASKFVFSIKMNGKFVRDQDDTFRLPFGSEYSLFLKNINNRRAVVSISIDGKDVLDGKQIIAMPSEAIELEGFLTGRRVENKFKFIELTKEIEEHRGYFPEDSNIRVEVRFEKPYTYNFEPYTLTRDNTWRSEWKENTYNIDVSCYNVSNSDDQAMYSAAGHASTGEVRRTASLGEPPQASSCRATGMAAAASAPSNDNDLGITVEGSESNQGFVYGSIGALEEVSYVFTARLSGYKDEEKVKVVFTTKEKKVCQTCGKENKFYDKFCSRCGTFLK
jgi:hypothetical protein